MSRAHSQRKLIYLTRRSAYAGDHQEIRRSASNLRRSFVFSPLLLNRRLRTWYGTCYSPVSCLKVLPSILSGT